MFFYSKSFTFNGETSDSYNVWAVEFGRGGLQNYDYGLAKTSIIEEKIPRKDKPFFLGVDSSPMDFDFTIIKQDGTEFTKTELTNIYTWLMHDYYKILISNEDTDVKYNVIFTNPRRVTIGSRKHGLQFTARCDAPYGYLLEQEDNYMVTGSQVITIDMTASNYKKDYYNVEIEFTLGVGQTTLSIENTTNSKTSSFTGLTGGETIYMNNERKEILSDLEDNRYNEFNLTWFRLKPNAVNSITITGDCDITFKYSLPILI